MKMDEKKKILVLEMDAGLRSLLIGYCSSFGYEPIEARTTDDAEKILSNGESVDLLLTDITLGKNRNQEKVHPEGGFRLIQELKERGHYLFDSPKPYVILTAASITKEANHWCLDHSVPVLGKPYRPAELKAVLEERLGC